jgi:hypothetical protein
MEGRIASITTCLSQLTAQEEARETKRKELAAQVHLKCCSKGGHVRRGRAGGAKGHACRKQQHGST